MSGWTIEDKQRPSQMIIDVKLHAIINVMESRCGEDH